MLLVTPLRTPGEVKSLWRREIRQRPGCQVPALFTRALTRHTEVMTVADGGASHRRFERRALASLLVSRALQRALCDSAHPTEGVGSNPPEADEGNAPPLAQPHSRGTKRAAFPSNVCTMKRHLAAGKLAQYLDRHLGGAWPDHVDGAGCALGQINDSASHEGAAVVDAHND